MAYTYLTQVFTGGLNKDIDPAAIDLTMGQDLTVSVVADSQNFLFERGLAITRPGIAAISSPTQTITAGQTVYKVEGLNIAPLNGVAPAVNRGAYTLTLDGSNHFHLWAINGLVGSGQVYDVNEITGPGGYTPALNAGFSVGEVNGVFLFGTYNGGMMRWDPNLSTYTIMTPSSNFAYVTGHYSRAVAAYGGPSTALYHQTVGWSASGDETNWTSLDAGISTLADVPDSLTGIGVINGVVILARTYGFHLGWATGTFPIIYNWRMYSQNSVGCFYPATFKIYQNVAYFLSMSGIHTFDGTTVEDIGEGVYNEMMTHIQSDFTGSMQPIAFISPSYNTDWRPAYHVILVRSAISLPRAENPHYVYDIREKKWSRHVYVSTNLANAFYITAFHSSATTANPYITVVNQAAGPVAPTFQAWSPGTNLDVTGTITTGQICLSGDHTRDKQLSRILVIYWSFGAAVAVNFTINFILAGTPGTTNFTFNTYASGGLWDKRWLDIRQTGDFFQVQVSVSTSLGTPFKLKKLIFEFDEIGKVRT